MDICRELFLLQDLEYKEFHSRLMPTIDDKSIIGIRIPMLRQFAKAVGNAPEAEAFMAQLPHKYYEENNLHAFLIEQIKDYDEALRQTERFLPYIDYWATCDSFLPKIFKKNTDKLIVKINEWLKSDKTYTIRYAIGLLMSLYLDEGFKAEYAEEVSKIKSEEYYVNMMIAWYFATALAKQYDAVIPYLTEKRHDKWVHNKTIQKAIESRRILPETKEMLKKLKIKE